MFCPLGKRTQNAAFNPAELKSIYQKQNHIIGWNKKRILLDEIREIMAKLFIIWNL